MKSELIVSSNGDSEGLPSVLMKPYHIITGEKWIRRIIVGGGALFVLTHVGPTILAGLAIYNAITASFLSAGISSIAAFALFRALPFLSRLINMQIESWADKITRHFVNQNPVLYLKPYYDQVVRGRDTFSRQADGLSGVIGQIEKSKAEAEEKAAKEERAARRFDGKDEFQFVAAAGRAARLRGLCDKLQRRISSLEGLKEQLLKLLVAHDIKVADLQVEMDSLRVDWDTSALFESAADSAETVLGDGRKSPERIRAEMAAAEIVQRYNGQFSRLTRVLEASSDIIAAYQEDQEDAADALRAKWQAESAQIVASIDSREMVPVKR